MPKTRKVKSWKSDAVPHQQMLLRAVQVRAETANDEAKSVEVVIASEHPVERYDYDRGEVYNEILMMDGVQFRNEKRQLPIVDSHDRSTVRNVLGSVRNVRVEGDQLVGDAVFARDADSQTAYEKLKDGHLTDFSITATPRDTHMVARDETFRMPNGTEIKGPAELVRSWTPTDASLVAAGADVTSTVRNLRRAYEIPSERSNDPMTEETRAKLREQGMPEEIENEADALEWLIEKMGEEKEDVEMADEAPEEEVAKADEPDEEVEKADDEESVEMTVDRALKADRVRRKEITALCDKAGIERAFADRLCDEGVDLDRARQEVLERMVNQPLGTSAGGEQIQVTADANDKFYAAVRDGLISRALGACGKDPFKGQKPEAGYEDFQHMGMLRMAEEILRRGNVNTTRMRPRDIAMVAMNHRPTIERMKSTGIIRSGDPAYHVTGTFPNLLLDAANKSLLAGYDEAPYTWSMWARQAPSVDDFKNINRIRFSESPDVEEVPENNPYPEKAMSDSKEAYKVAKYGAIFSVTWETVVNDDLDAISRIPQMHGNAARRKQNKEVYAILTANDNMSDGVALFASGHSNNATSTGAPSVTTLNAGFTAMMTQTGLSSDAIINVTPRFLIVPAALAATAYQLVGSIADPSAGGSNAGNSNTLNLYGPQGPRPLTVVPEPQLDGNSTTAWYLAAANSQVDTVELTFLSGEESPVLENEWDFEKDVYRYKVRQTFGTKAIDWRGLYRNTG